MTRIYTKEVFCCNGCGHSNLGWTFAVCLYPDTYSEEIKYSKKNGTIKIPDWCKLEIKK